MSKITFDDSRRPLIFITWPHQYSTADVVEFVAQMKPLVKEKRRIAVINDVSRTRPPTAVERKMITDGVAAASDSFRDYVAGWSDVLRSPFIRGVITALLWVNPSVYPHEVHATLEEAEKWCRSQLDAQPIRRAGTSSSVPSTTDRIA